MRIAACCLMLTLLMGCQTDEQSDTKSLTMGFVPSRSVHEIQIASDRIADYLSKKPVIGSRPLPCLTMQRWPWP